MAPALASGLYSHESERLVIGVMLNSQRNGLHLSLISLIAYEDFFVDQHQTIWRIIASMREAGLTVDPMSLIDHANAQSEFVGGPEYIIDAFNDPIARLCSDESVTAAGVRIKDFSASRKLDRTLGMGRVLLTTGQPFEHVAGFVDDEIINLKRLSTSSRSGPRAAAYFYDAILAKITAKLDGEVVDPGIPTGFHEMDQLMSGQLPPEGLIVLAGRPSMGKSAFASAIEQNISNSGIATLFFSMEMTGVSLASRNLSRHSRIPFRHIKTAEIDEHEFAPMIESLEILGRAPCYIDETPGLSMAEIRARSRAFKQLHPKCAIFLDYMQIVQPGRDSKSKEPRMVVTETSLGLTGLARELKCPVVALAQLNRDLEKRANKRPIMSDLRDSGQVEQDASIIVFLYRDEFYNPDSPDRGITEAIFVKNRDGECATIKFSSDLSRMLYAEIGTYQNQEA